GEDHRADHHGEVLVLLVVVELDRHHAANGYAEKFHWRIDIEAAQGLVEAHLYVAWRAVRGGHGPAHVGKQREFAVLCGGSGVGAVVGGAEGDAAGEYRRERLGIDSKAVGGNRHVDTAGVPEARVVGDEVVVGRVDEHLDLDTLAIVGQAERDHLTNLEAAKIQRRADAERAQVIGVQGELLALDAKGHRWRRFQADELATGFLGPSGIRADEGAGQQGVDAGYTTGADTRPYDPELGVFAGKGFGMLVQLDRGDDASVILAEVDFGDLADDHVLVLDLRLVGLEPFGRLEAHGDLRTGRKPVLQHHGKAHQRRGDGDQPDQRDASASLPDLGSAGRCFGAVWVIGHRRSLHPRSIAGRRSSRPASSARPPGRRTGCPGAALWYSAHGTAPAPPPGPRPARPASTSSRWSR